MAKKGPQMTPQMIVTVERDDRQYFAYFEDLPGVHGLGSSIDQAKRSLVEAIGLRALQIKKTRGSPKNS
jgi:predicted RNase H-like HicB family nuclease